MCSLQRKCRCTFFYGFVVLLGLDFPQLYANVVLREVYERERNLMWIANFLLTSNNHVLESGIYGWNLKQVIFKQIWYSYSGHISQTYSDINALRPIWWCFNILGRWDVWDLSGEFVKNKWCIAKRRPNWRRLWPHTKNYIFSHVTAAPGPFDYKDQLYSQLE